MTDSIRKESKLNYDALFLTEKIKCRKEIVITMHDNEVFHEYLKWFTNDFLGTVGGKLISRQFVKTIS